MQLSDRMLAVVGLVEECDCMADIGCDHAFVSIYLPNKVIMITKEL